MCTLTSRGRTPHAWLCLPRPVPQPHSTLARCHYDLVPPPPSIMSYPLLLHLIPRRFVHSHLVGPYTAHMVVFATGHITNEEVKARIGNAIGPYEDLLTTVKRRKLKWYGHVTRSSGLAKTILQGTVQGGRRRGRQRKRWEDNIKEWTGLPWNITLRKAENREEWRKLVVKSTVVPQRSARLRDR